LPAARRTSWETVISALAPVVTIAGIVAGVWQFERGENDRAKEAFNQQLFLQRISACQKVAEVSGEIAATTASSRARRDQLAEQFNAYYWGLMALVEDANVETAMNEFYYELHDYIVGSIWTDANKIKTKALALAKACRSSIEDRREAGL
jgi:hypothetical protein